MELPLSPGLRSHQDSPLCVFQMHVLASVLDPLSTGLGDCQVLPCPRAGVWAQRRHPASFPAAGAGGQYEQHTGCP